MSKAGASAKETGSEADGPAAVRPDGSRDRPDGPGRRQTVEAGEKRRRSPVPPSAPTVADDRRDRPDGRPDSLDQKGATTLGRGSLSRGRRAPIATARLRRWRSIRAPSARAANYEATATSVGKSKQGEGLDGEEERGPAPTSSLSISYSGRRGRFPRLFGLERAEGRRRISAAATQPACQYSATRRGPDGTRRNRMAPSGTSRRRTD